MMMKTMTGDRPNCRWMRKMNATMAVGRSKTSAAVGCPSWSRVGPPRMGAYRWWRRTRSWTSGGPQPRRTMKRLLRMWRQGRNERSARHWRTTAVRHTSLRCPGRHCRWCRPRRSRPAAVRSSDSKSTGCLSASLECSCRHADTRRPARQTGGAASSCRLVGVWTCALLTGMVGVGCRIRIAGPVR